MSESQANAVPVAETPSPATRYDYAAWVLTALALVAIIKWHLLPALLAGLLVHELAAMLAVRLGVQNAATTKARVKSLAIIGTVLIVLLSLLGWGVVAVMRSEAGSVAALLGKMAEIIDSIRDKLPPAIGEALPMGDADELKELIVDWLREHAHDLQTMGASAGKGLAHVLVGMILGAMVCVSEGHGTHVIGPLAATLTERIRRLANAFRRIVFAQVKISALNATLTAIYLMVILPLAGIHLPLTKTMIVVTFLVGLFPVIGNLISNTVIVVVSLSVGLGAAIASLVFLVVIHKLEYFVNARIVGSQINAKAWELLGAMLVMEAAFGLPGVVAAPIFYAYLKMELTDRKVI